MTDIDQSEVLAEGLASEITDDPGAPGTALVPLAAPTQWAPKVPLPHADPSFVTQLIATAEREPQTRGLRRGSMADAQSAYGPHDNERRSVTRRTRQII